MLMLAFESVGANTALFPHTYWKCVLKMVLVSRIAHFIDKNWRNLLLVLNSKHQ